jgi:hypothetical protein
MGLLQHLSNTAQIKGGSKGRHGGRRWRGTAETKEAGTKVAGKDTSSRRLRSGARSPAPLLPHPVGPAARRALPATAATASSRRGYSTHAPAAPDYASRRFHRSATLCVLERARGIGLEEEEKRRRGLEREDRVVVHLRPYARRPPCPPTTPIPRTQEAIHPAFQPHCLLDSRPHLQLVHLQPP